MAVKIDEMYVDVQEPSPTTSSPTSTETPQKDVDMRAVLEMIWERKLRLQAD